MSPRRGRHSMSRRHADRVLDTPLVLASTPCLTKCLPTNTTWTGGIGPYSLLVADPESRRILQRFTDITDTYFVWTPNVPAETRVLLKVVDAQRVFSATEDPIPVLESPARDLCIIFLPVVSASATGYASSIAPSSASGAPSSSSSAIASPSASLHVTAYGFASSHTSAVLTLSSMSAALPFISNPVTTHPASNTVPSTPSAHVSGSSTTFPFPSHIPSFAPSAIAVSQATAVSPSTIAVVVLTVVVFLSWTFPWWRAWLPVTRRRRDNRNDTDSEKQDTIDGRTRDEPMSELSADADPGSGQFGQAAGYPDVPATPLLNPFKIPKNIVQLEHVSAALSKPELSSHDQPQSPPGRVISPPQRSLRAATRNSPFPVRSRTPTIVARERTSYVSVRPKTTTTRLSTTTSSDSGSTLPPSYRSNRSTAYTIPTRTPSESYPPFPPPVYTAPPLPPPLPSAFRMPVPESSKAGQPRRSLRSSLAGPQRGYQSLKDTEDIDGAEGRRVNSESGTVRAAPEPERRGVY